MCLLNYVSYWVVDIDPILYKRYLLSSIILLSSIFKLKGLLISAIDDLLIYHEMNYVIYFTSIIFNYSDFYPLRSFIF